MSEKYVHYPCFFILTEEREREITFVSILEKEEGVPFLFRSISLLYKRKKTYCDSLSSLRKEEKKKKIGRGRGEGRGGGRRRGNSAIGRKKEREG